VQLEGLRGAQAGVQVFEVAGGDDLPQVLLGDGDGGRMSWGMVRKLGVFGGKGSWRYS
jgi:hypothetical protein